jgi:hypothetical protein
VQHVYYVDEMAAVLADMGPAALHLLSGTNTDSGRKTTVILQKQLHGSMHVKGSSVRLFSC